MLARFLVAVCGLAFLSPSDASPVRAPLNGLPDLVLWVWERPDDLRALDPGIGVAFLAQTLTISDHGLRTERRRQPLHVAPRARVVAVTRIEVDPAWTPTLDADLTRAVASIVASTATLPRVRAVQIDFDARASEREFYRQVIRDVRHAVDPAVALSMTALASWCVGDDWLRGLPVDEAVPMRCSRSARARPVSRGAQSKSAAARACRGAVGVSLRRATRDHARTAGACTSSMPSRSEPRKPSRRRGGLRSDKHGGRCDSPRLATGAGVRLRDGRRDHAGVGLRTFYFAMPTAVTLAPDDLEAYARGELGIVKPSYARRYLVHAYRVLSGGPQRGAPAASDFDLGPDYVLPDPSAVNAWLQAKARVLGETPPPVAKSTAPLETERAVPGVEYRAFRQLPRRELLACPANARRSRAAIRCVQRRAARVDACASDGLSQLRRGQDRGDAAAAAGLGCSTASGRPRIPTGGGLVLWHAVRRGGRALRRHRAGSIVAVEAVRPIPGGPDADPSSDARQRRRPAQGRAVRTRRDRARRHARRIQAQGRCMRPREV